MDWTPELSDFIQAHIDDDTATLLLSAHRHGGVDVPFAVGQIEARRRLKGKLPEWYQNAGLIMGGRVPAEQCSSELTARYKRGLVEGESLCDLTGGMGVDLWYMSEGMRRAIYTERQATLCEAARHNFQVLADGRHPDIEVRHGDGRELPIPSVDVLYLDPARRAGDGSRVYAIEDCEPNLVAWQGELLRHAPTVVAKLSPMVDLTDVLRKLRGVTELHVVAVRNECKEVLVKMRREADVGVVCHCVDFLSSGRTDYSSTFPDTLVPPVVQAVVGRYLYEPDVTLMKARLFGSLCQQFQLCQLDHDTHLMTSGQLHPDFPGRIFCVDEQIPFSSKTLRRLKSRIPQANIATRNFPLTADQLRRRTAIRDGGEVYLFGAKVNLQGPQLLLCYKALP